MCESCDSTAAIVRITVSSGDTRVLCLSCASAYVRETLPRARVDPLRFWTHFANPRTEGSVRADDSRLEECACPQCLLTFEEFRRVGLTGCSGCYTAFETVILPALHEIHTATGP